MGEWMKLRRELKSGAVRPRRRVALEKFAESALPTTRGDFRIVVFRETTSRKEHVALIKGDVENRSGVPVRIHSECLTSEVFGSVRCDCRAQLDFALDYISAHRCGIIVYLRQEGRGIGLGYKIRAYALQQNDGLDTVDANLKLGFADDLRRYDVAADMLRQLKVASVDLITNNPKKIAGIASEGIVVRRRLRSKTKPNALNFHYLKTKRDRSGHLIDFLADAVVKQKRRLA